MFINRRFYIAVIIIVFCFIGGYKSALVFTIAQFFLLALVILCGLDYVFLFKRKGELRCTRECSDRFSNGDENEIKLHLSNTYSLPVVLKIIDEVPDIFQMRNILFNLEIKDNQNKVLKYTLRPVKRGVYRFGLVNIFASTKIGLLSRKFKTAAPFEVKVYPSFLRLRQYELMAISNKLTAPGLKRVRKIGMQLEPDQIKDYVKGDDYRTINWKATARRTKLMVNVFQEEKAQNVYCLIDKGRTMQSACEGMTLLDYSINASLALSYVAMIKGDKSGLLTFEKVPETLVPASRHAGHLQKILDVLYSQQTTFSESDFSALYQFANKNIKMRSLFLVYTNFDTVPAMKRQLTFLSMLAKRHTVIVVFFENTELKELSEIKPQTKEEVYEKVIAEKIGYEKLLIVSRLRQNNIISILTHPTELTPQVINKYLEIKARGIN